MSRAIALLILPLVVGCTPQSALLMAAVPDGTASILLSHLQHVENTNRRTIVAFERRRDWIGLVHYADENIKRDPHTADWWLVSGYAYTQMKAYGQAARCYAEAVRVEPDVLLGWKLLAEAYRSDGKPRRAAATINNALLVREDDPQLYYVLGESDGDLGRWEPALAAYQQAVKLDRQFAQAWLNLGRTYVRLGRVDEARKLSPILQQLDPRLAQELARELQSAGPDGTRSR